MGRLILSTLAAGAIAASSAASASITLYDQNGPDLNTKIYASHDPTNVAPNVGPVVYGNTNTTSGHDVKFSGYTSFNTGTNTGTATSISITGGSGFAQIFDTDYVNNGTIATNDLFALVIDPDMAFTEYEFSIMLSGNGSLYAYYWLTGGSGWIQADPLAGILTGGSDNQFILKGLPGGMSFDKVLLATTSAINQVKQNSITTAAGAVPEPGTWMLMLLGFGGMGLTVRRGRKGRSTLLQIA